MYLEIFFFIIFPYNHENVPRNFLYAGEACRYKHVLTYACTRLVYTYVSVYMTTSPLSGFITVQHADSQLP